MEQLRPGDPASVGPYRLEGRLGEGGMGLVYAARSPGGRRIAVKVVRAEYAADPKFRQRFAREVEAARRVGGFHTAQIVAADPQAALPWMATAYIDAPSLLDLVRDAGPLPVDPWIKLARELAEGIAAIHECDLVHRDLKPGNLLMAADGVRIIDFGIASTLGANPLTSVGVAIGTFAYMSPEQVAPREIGPASDVFSLGSVLTFAAAGHGPFDADGIPAIAQKIATEEPDLSGVPDPLRRVIVACLAKTPEERPSAAAVLPLIDVAEAELRTAPEPGPETGPEAPAALPTVIVVSAPPPQPPPQPSPEAATKTADPEKPIAADPSSNPDPAEQEPDTLGPGGRRALIAVLACSVIAAAIVIPAALLSKDPSHAPASPPTASPPTASPTLLKTLSAPDYTYVDSVAFAPNGTTLATGDFDGNTYLWSTASGKITATLAAPGSADATIPVSSMAFTPNGTTLATGDGDGHTYLWNTATGSITATLTSPTGDSLPVESVAFTPNGNTVATTDGISLCLWDTATGKLIATLTDPDGNNADVNALAFAPDGATLAGADGAGDIYFWDTATGKLTTTLHDPNGAAVSAVAFAPNGKILATGDSSGNGTGSGGDVDLWDIAGGKVVSTLADPASDTVNSVAFTPNGTTLADGDGTVTSGGAYSWGTATGKITAYYACSDGPPVSSVAFSPNGTTLALGCKSGETALWRTVSPASGTQ